MNGKNEISDIARQYHLKLLSNQKFTTTLIA